MPILKEFDLDIPYPKRDGTPEDYRANWKQKGAQFRDEIRCIASLYEKSFEKMKTADSWKVLIECVDEISDSRVIDLLGVCTTQVQFDVDSFFFMDENQKKITTLNLLKQGIEKIVPEKGWDPAPFNKAFEKVIKAEMNNEWFWRKPISSPERKLKASLYIVHEVTIVKGYLIVFDNKNQEVLRSEVFRDRPNEWAYVPYLGKIQWLSSKEVALFNKENELVSQISLVHG